MAGANNIPREVQDSIRDVLDQRIKICVKRMVKQEVRADKFENRVLAFTPCRLYVLASKVPSRVEHNFHFLDFQALESKKPNQLAITVDGKVYSFTTLEADTEEVNHMITHIGVSLKHIFPAFPLERLIIKVEVLPPERLRTMHEMIRDIENREVGPCGGFTTMYACMCDYYSLPYREEVAWDVDTIYLSQDSRELCLRDFDHLKEKDLIPIIGALEHNTWFTGINVNSIKLTPEMANEIVKVMRRNAFIEELKFSNTGVKVDFVQKLSTAILSNSGTQLGLLDLSGNTIEDRGATSLMGTLKSLSRGLNYLDLSRTGLTTKCIAKIAETLSQSQTLLTSLRTLKFADNGQKGEDFSSVYSFLAQPNNLTTLDLSGTDCAMDNLCSPLIHGCPHLTALSLAGTVFTQKKTKEVLVPVSWKQYFASACSLQKLDLSATRLPPEALKELLLGLASNPHIRNVELDLSSNELGSAGAHVIGGCIANITSLARLDLSNNNFDTDLRVILPEIAKNRHLKHLSIGRNFSMIKPKYMMHIMDGLVQLIQEDASVLESLSLAESKLKHDLTFVINALGSNTSLQEIDISGNNIGDFGARMLCKALQINTHLQAVVWDKNGVTAQGFEDIAEALEKNFTMKRMPFPVNDAAAAMRLQPERTEAALQKVERLLQRNHSPRKFASDQQYRLQQGFLISSTQQMVDRLCVQVQDEINALTVNNSETLKEELDQASKVIKDADNSKQLLPRLQVVGVQMLDSGDTVETTLQTMAESLKTVMEQIIQKTVEDMLKCTLNHCAGIMADKDFAKELEAECRAKSTLPREFAKLLLNGVSTDVFNKLNELNLGVAAHISDSVIDEVISKLSDSHKSLTNHLNLTKSRRFQDSAQAVDQPEKTDTDNEKEKDERNAGRGVEMRPRINSQPFYMLPSEFYSGTPKLSTKRKSVYSRKLRPQSTIDCGNASKQLDSGSLAETLEETLCESRLSMHEEADEDQDSRPCPPRLEKVTEIQNRDLAKGSFEALDNLPELPVQKLEHLNKARPKRNKSRAPTRPVAPGIDTPDEISDDGINAFYDTKRTSPEDVIKDTFVATLQVEDSSSKVEKKKGSPLAKTKPQKGQGKDDKEKEKKDKGSFSGISNFFRKGPSKVEAREKKQELPRTQENTRVYSRTSKTILDKKDSPDSAHVPATQSAKTESKTMLESPRVLLPPKVSEDIINLDPKTDARPRPPVEVKKPPAVSKGEAHNLESKSSESEESDEEKTDEDDLENIGTRTASAKGDEQQGKETVEGKSQEVPVRVAKHVGFSATILADFKAKQEKRASQLSLTSDNGKDTKESTVKSEPSERKEEANNNTVINEKGLAAKGEMTAKQGDEAASRQPLKQLGGETSALLKPRALMPPKKPVATVTVSLEKGEVLKPPSAPESSASVPAVGTGETPVPKPRPPPPAKPKPPLTAPKPRLSSGTNSEEDSVPTIATSGSISNAGERRAEGEIVYDSSTLRLSVKDKIKRLSQVKLQPPSAPPAQLKTPSLQKDVNLPDSISEADEHQSEEETSRPSSIEDADGRPADSQVSAQAGEQGAAVNGKKSAVGDDEIMV
ncbi:F-actin-uncapping protein LRRC16A-like isoform X5 [Pomacea canaliculata]|uniref:F-actin-uncapping protein LRRC16A-like isoform X5 n=1 Tax=Pomacea canaliculata TaxID=400727 RepID=UPI000D73B9AE|nr:F-actin-uncapping protein LRRC16A-like isoform X5 [Pomacea canaliculata]